ncbi:MAG: NAD(P)H-hydrate epimerase, partial [Ottowia sp.]|nr:NAD(P)H-hydrate epimerase [Ottowia sp.]
MPALIPLDARAPFAAPLFDIAATRRIEAAAAAALPAHTLMPRAGTAVARLALALAPHARCVWIACGPGNNGGDGLEAAMHLRQWGANPVVTWLGDEARLPGDARASLRRARAAGVCFADTPPALGAHDLAIDALLGIGATRAPAGRMAEVLAQLHASAAPLLAVDAPTGLDVDTGVFSASLPAHQAGKPMHTLALLTLKPGLFTAHGRDACGTLWFDDLSVNTADEAPTARLNAPPPPAPRAHASHKGSFGDVAIIGGAADMGGAAYLAA